MKAVVCFLLLSFVLATNANILGELGGLFTNGLTGLQKIKGSAGGTLSKEFGEEKQSNSHHASSSLKRRQRNRFSGKSSSSSEPDTQGSSVHGSQRGRQNTHSGRKSSLLGETNPFGSSILKNTGFLDKPLKLAEGFVSKVKGFYGDLLNTVKSKKSQA